jgi:polysaccharide pyruvyl transferase WcaK-like protein
VILAQRLAIPVIAISHHPKIAAAMTEAGLGDYVVSAVGEDARSVMSLVDRALSDQSRISTRLSTYRDECSAKVKQQFAILIDIAASAKP